LVNSAREAEDISLDDELTRSSRPFVTNFVTKKVDTITLASELEPMVEAFASSRQSEQAARQAAYSEALASLQKNHQAITAAQDKLSALSGKLRTLSLPYSNSEVFELLLNVGENVKSELDDQEKKDSAAAAKSAATTQPAKSAVTTQPVIAPAAQ
jgi:FtsZ-binding cell division protein ZapB